jgi:hypothetical protein
MLWELVTSGAAVVVAAPGGGLVVAKAYVTRLLAKPDVRGRVQLVIIAYGRGLVAPLR